MTPIDRTALVHPTSNLDIPEPHTPVNEINGPKRWAAGALKVTDLGPTHIEVEHFNEDDGFFWYKYDVTGTPEEIAAVKTTSSPLQQEPREDVGHLGALAEEVLHQGRGRDPLLRRRDRRQEVGGRSQRARHPRPCAQGSELRRRPMG
jgi:hypothetical protein